MGMVCSVIEVQVDDVLLIFIHFILKTKIGKLK